MEEPAAFVRSVDHAPPPPVPRHAAVLSCILCDEFIGMAVLGIRYRMLSEYIIVTLLGLGAFYAVHGLLRTDSFDS